MEESHFFCPFIQRSKSDPFNLVEFFQALPKRQSEQLWGAVVSLCQEWVERLDREEEGEQEGENEVRVCQYQSHHTGGIFWGVWGIKPCDRCPGSSMCQPLVKGVGFVWARLPYLHPVHVCSVHLLLVLLLPSVDYLFCTVLLSW